MKPIKSNPVAGHIFTLTVKNNSSRRSAELAVMAAFAKRNPDGCEFYLNNYNSHKEAYMAGSMSGVQLGFDLSLRAIESQIQHLKLKRNGH